MYSVHSTLYKIRKLLKYKISRFDRIKLINNIRFLQTYYLGLDKYVVMIIKNLQLYVTKKYYKQRKFKITLYMAYYYKPFYVVFNWLNNNINNLCIYFFSYETKLIPYLIMLINHSSLYIFQLTLCKCFL